jgi:hypothetical protein
MIASRFFLSNFADFTYDIQRLNQAAPRKNRDKPIKKA